MNKSSDLAVFGAAARASGPVRVVSVASFARAAGCSRKTASRRIEKLLNRGVIHRATTDDVGARYAHGAHPRQRFMSPAERDLDNFRSAENRYSLQSAPGISVKQYATVSGFRLSAAYERIRRMLSRGEILKAGRGAKGARLYMTP